MSRIYTKTGDKGLTGLRGGKRVAKHSLRIETLGQIDELNAFLGLVLSSTTDSEFQQVLSRIQNQLFDLGSELANPSGSENNQKYWETAVLQLEEDIDSFDSQLTPLKNFILPGGTLPSALLHVARSVCRRAERTLSALETSERGLPGSLMFLNRLSDLLFVLARTSNARSNVEDVKWTKER